MTEKSLVNFSQRNKNFRILKTKVWLPAGSWPLGHGIVKLFRALLGAIVQSSVIIRRDWWSAAPFMHFSTLLLVLLTMSLLGGLRTLTYHTLKLASEIVLTFGVQSAQYARLLLNRIKMERRN